VTGDEVLVVTDGPKADGVEKAQWIEQVEEAAAAVEELDPRDRKTPLQDVAVAVTSPWHCIRCRRKHEFRDFAYAWLQLDEGSVCPSCMTPDEQREMAASRSAV
jgi:rubrerythrin